MTVGKIEQVGSCGSPRDESRILFGSWKYTLNYFLRTLIRCETTFQVFHCGSFTKKDLSLFTWASTWVLAWGTKQNRWSCFNHYMLWQDTSNCGALLFMRRETWTGCWSKNGCLMVGRHVLKVRRTWRKSNHVWCPEAMEIRNSKTTEKVLIELLGVFKTSCSDHADHGWLGSTLENWHPSTFFVAACFLLPTDSKVAFFISNFVKV